MAKITVSTCYTWTDIQKKSTVTSLFDLPLRCQRSKRSKFGIISIGQSNNANLFEIDRYLRVSTVTSSSDLPLRGQRSKKVKITNYFRWQK